MTDSKIVPLFKTAPVSAIPADYIDDDTISLPPPPPSEPTENEQALQFLIEYLQTEGASLKHFIFIGEKWVPSEAETPFPIIHGPVTKADFALNLAILQSHFMSKLLD